MKEKWENRIYKMDFGMKVLKIELFGKEENKRGEKMRMIKMKVGPIIFYPPNIEKKNVIGFFFIKTVKRKLLFSPFISYKKIK